MACIAHRSQGEAEQRPDLASMAATVAAAQEQAQTKSAVQGPLCKLVEDPPGPPTATLSGRQHRRRVFRKLEHRDFPGPPTLLPKKSLAQVVLESVHRLILGHDAAREGIAYINRFA